MPLAENTSWIVVGVQPCPMHRLRARMLIDFELPMFDPDKVETVYDRVWYVVCPESESYD